MPPLPRVADSHPGKKDHPPENPRAGKWLLPNGFSPGGDLLNGCAVEFVIMQCAI